MRKASGSGLSTKLGTAMQRMKARLADSTPGPESSMARHSSQGTSRRRATSRKTSGAGFPFGTSSAETTAWNGALSWVAVSTRSITWGEEPDAQPSLSPRAAIASNRRTISGKARVPAPASAR